MIGTVVAVSRTLIISARKATFSDSLTRDQRVASLYGRQGCSRPSIMTCASMPISWHGSRGAPGGRGYQTEINRALREYVLRREPSA